MASTTTTTVAGSIRRVDQLALLKQIEGRLLMPRFAKQGGVEYKGGDRYRVHRLLRPSKKTTLTTSMALLKGDDSSLKAFTSNYQEFVMEILEDAFAFDRDADIQSLIQTPEYQSQVANQAARSIEYWLMKKLAAQGAWWRIDGLGASMVKGTCGANSSATVFHDANRTEADNFWGTATAANHLAQLCIYNPDGSAFDTAGQVSTWLTASDSGTVAFTNALTTSSKYFLTRKTGITSSNPMTVAGLLKGARWHEHLQTPRLSGGILGLILSSSQKHDLMTDAAWASAVQYDRSAAYENYQPLRWYDIDAYVGSEIFRSDADGTENQASGAVHHSIIFGADTFTALRFGQANGAFNATFSVVDKADSYNLNLHKKYLSWIIEVAGGVLNATGVFNLLTGATDFLDELV